MIFEPVCAGTAGWRMDPWPVPWRTEPVSALPHGESAVKSWVCLAMLGIGTLLVTPVLADGCGVDDLADDVDTDAGNRVDQCVETGEWQIAVAFGVGYAANPLVDGADVWLPLLPRLSYYGERAFFDNGTFGYTLSESTQQRLNLLARPNLDYFFFADSGSFSQVLTHPFFYSSPGELSERKLTYLAGLEYSWFQGAWQLQASVGHDISVGHDGTEAGLQVNHHWQHGDSTLQTRFGWLYRDARLSRYYYGISIEETTWFEQLYQPDASWSPSFSLAAEHQLGEHTSLVLLLAAQRVSKEIADSPLLDRRLFVASFVGVAYAF